MRTNDRCERRQGMSLIEMVISMGIFGLVVAGSISSAILFAKIAAEHQNQADFSHDVRYGFEQLSLDARNANRIVNRSANSFTFGYPNSGNVRYSYDASAQEVSRSFGGNSRVVFRNVSELDVLVNAGDASGNPDLRFDTNRLSIETLAFSGKDGTPGGSSLELSNISFTIRNGG